MMFVNGRSRVEEHLRNYVGIVPKGKGICDDCLEGELRVKLEDIQAVGDLPYFDRFPGMRVGCDGCEKLVTRYF